jgi:ABC-type polysaccharide/polyol phosphate export permease
MWPLVRAYREVILEGRLPQAGELAPVAALALGAFLISYLVFKRYEPVFVEVA